MSAGRTTRFAELQLAAAGPLVGPWRFDGSVVLLDYQDLDSFDQLNANAGARYRLPLGDWTGEAALQLSYSTLDSEGFENRRMLLLQATRTLTEEWRAARPLPLQRHRRARRLRRPGWHAATSSASAACGTGTAGMSDWNIDSTATTTPRRALSFDRHQLGVDVQRDLDENWTVQAGLSFDRSRYDVATNGSEERAELRLAVSRNLNDTWRAVVRYAYADNQADLPEFDYRRNRRLGRRRGGLVTAPVPS